MDKSNPYISSLSFIKICLVESASTFSLPPAFVKKLHSKGKFPQTPVVLKIQTGQKWRVEIETSGERAFFGKGWLDFVKDTKIQFGDFLVFRLIDNSSFQVYIFAPNGCQRYLSSATPSPTTCKSSCSTRITDSDLKDTINDDDDGDTHVEDDDHEVDGEKDIELQPFDEREKFIKPYFQKVLSTFNLYTVDLPNQFVLESGLRNAGETILRNKSGREWIVTIKKYTQNRLYRVYISHGWGDFRRANKLMEGDTCSFQYSHGKGSSQSGYVLVEVVKKATRKSERPPWIQAARKRGRPLINRPGKRSNIDHSIKRRVSSRLEEIAKKGMKEEEDEEDEEQEGEEAMGSEENPCFTYSIRQYNKCYVLLPIAFARYTGIIDKKSVRLIDEKNRDYKLKVGVEGPRCSCSVRLGKWSACRKANNLVNGDLCLFKFIRSSGSIHFKKIKK